MIYEDTDFPEYDRIYADIIKEFAHSFNKAAFVDKEMWSSKALQILRGEEYVETVTQAPNVRGSCKLSHLTNSEDRSCPCIC